MLQRAQAGADLGVRRDGQEHVVGQQVYSSSDGRRMGWLRVLCPGYRPEMAAQPRAATR